VLASTGKPLVAIVVLPLSSDDAQAKHNALEALGEFAKFAQSKKVSCIITVDNAKIETIYKDVSQLNFYEIFPFFTKKFTRYCYRWFKVPSTTKY